MEIDERKVRCACVYPFHGIQNQHRYGVHDLLENVSIMMGRSGLDLSRSIEIRIAAVSPNRRTRNKTPDELRQKECRCSRDQAEKYKA